VVASRDVEVGMVVAPGAPLARIIAVRPIKVALGVPELDIGAVAIGGKVRVTFDALPDRVYEGVVSYVGAEVNKAARVFDAEIILPNQDKSIRPEMSAKAVFTGGKVKNAVVIPQTAVVELATGHMAFIVGPDNIAHMRAIEVTDYSEGRALIKSGLAAGDRLVILGHRDLIDGDKVEIGE
jgi:RND family efflux transporter MFP subunit